METRKVNGRESWSFGNNDTRVSVTVDGGQMAPVRFFAGSDDPIEPYYISPWQEESSSIPGPAVLGSLRGDFFCMPFGGDNDYNGESHPPHGEVSNSAWSFEGIEETAGRQALVLTLDTRVRPGTITKRIEVRTGESSLYITHDIEGFTGPVTLGHHAIMPGDRTHFVDSRPLELGLCDTAPPPASAREYFWAEPGAVFESLDAVPSIWKKPANLDSSIFPGLEGYVNILQVFPVKPVDGTAQWITATVPSKGYLWYSLKDPDLLPSTVLWQENRGRHGEPWNGRNCCMGIEEVRAHLASGLKVSVDENTLTRRGLETSLNLDGGQQLSVRNIQGVCRIPEGFDRVADVEFLGDGVTFVARSGKRADAAVDWKYVL